MNLNHLPSKEPNIRVGIILPIDKMTKVDIVLSDSDSFEIDSEEKLYPSCKNLNKLSIMTTESGLRLDELKCISKKISIKPIIKSENTFITLKDYFAFATSFKNASLLLVSFNLSIKSSVAAPPSRATKTLLRAQRDSSSFGDTSLCSSLVPEGVTSIAGNTLLSAS